MGPSIAAVLSGPPGSRTPISGVRCRRRPVGPAARLIESTSIARTFQKVRPRIELGLPPYRGGVLPEHLQTGCLRVVPAGLEPAYPVCKTGVFAARRRDELAGSSTGGIRTHRHQALDLAAMPVSVPCHEHRQLRVGESNLRLRAYETRPSTGPPASPRPRYRSGHAGLMRAGRAPARLERTQSPGGDSNSHASGARASEARASTSSATRRVVQWSVRESNPPLQLEGLMSLPIDERTFVENRQWVVKELNLPPSASQLDGNGFTGRREEHHPSESSRE